MSRLSPGEACIANPSVCQPLSAEREPAGPVGFGRAVELRYAGRTCNLGSQFRPSNFAMSPIAWPIRRFYRDLSLQVARGETLVLLGRSGSGKTTSLKLVNRLVSPTSGEIRVNDVPERPSGRDRLAPRHRLRHPGCRTVSAFHRRAKYWPGSEDRRMAGGAHSLRARRNCCNWSD